MPPQEQAPVIWHVSANEGIQFRIRLALAGTGLRQGTDKVTHCRVHYVFVRLIYENTRIKYIENCTQFQGQPNKPVEDKVDEYLADALEIVKAQASVRIMGEDEIASMLRKLADSLRGIDIGSTDPVEDRQLDAVTARNSIREKSVTCLECGQVFKILSSKHLASHGLAPTSYKEKYGIKPKTALAAKYLVRMRKKKMEEMKLWEKRQLHQEIRTGTS